MLNYRVKSHRRSRRVIVPHGSAPAPSANVVSVYEVIVQDATTLLWVFSSIVIGEPGSWAALEANDGGAGGFVAPSSVENSGDASFTAHYVGTSFDPATTWRMLTQPAGLVFPDGPMDLPQSGVVS